MAVPEGIPGAGVGKTSLPVRSREASPNPSNTLAAVILMTGDLSLQKDSAQGDGFAEPAAAAEVALQTRHPLNIVPQFNPQMLRVPQGDLMHYTRRTNAYGIQVEDTKICVIMVGLPARGKSFIAQKGKSPLSPQIP